MLRKILSFFFALFMFLPTAHSAEMVNVEYIHQYLNARWGIDLPYNPELKNPKVAANMEYLLTVVDIANEYLNGEKTTSYGTGEYATKLAADTIATNTAIDTLVRGPFTMTTTPDTTSYSMTIGAAGNFTIDWGDGKRETIRDKKGSLTTYSHTYSTAGEYIITIYGRATAYRTVPHTDYTDVSFYVDSANAQKISKISGSLGKIFPTLPDGSQPEFYRTFYYLTNLTEIPAELFDGIHGAPMQNMFGSTFRGTQITSIPENLFAGVRGAPAASMFDGTFWNTQITSIPENLFAGISGAPAARMFASTFQSTQITSIPEKLFAGVQGAPARAMFANTFVYTPITSIPDNLFAGISGAPAERMFEATFAFTNITSIPENLFAGIQGAPANGMFSNTFINCDSLQSIPENLFAGISGPAAESMFHRTFDSCTSLTGPSARINGQYLYEIWPDVRTYTYTYGGATGLSDYEQIPAYWK